MNTTTQFPVCYIHFILQQTFSCSPETFQKISHYYLDHYDWLRDDLLVDSLALVWASYSPWRNNLSVQCSSRDCGRFASL